jgi:hypothetical protein
MKLRFEDYASTPQPNRTFDIGTASELLMFLEEQRKESMMGELACDENGFKLHIGIDDDICMVEFLKQDGDSPYYMAVTPAVIVQGSHDFFACGSATEIRGRHCLPFNIFKKVVIDFLETGQRSQSIEWEEC